MAILCISAYTFVCTLATTLDRPNTHCGVLYERSHRVRNETHKAYSKASGFRMSGNKNGKGSIPTIAALPSLPTGNHLHTISSSPMAKRRGTTSMKHHWGLHYTQAHVASAPGRRKCVKFTCRRIICQRDKVCLAQ